MTKSKGEDFLNDSKEEVKEDKEVEKFTSPQNWICITECFCSDNGNPLRSKRWLPGDRVFVTDRPSKHFVTKDEYDTGAGGREEYLIKFQKFGGIVNDQVRNLELHVLKAYVIEQERNYLKQQARAL